MRSHCHQEPSTSEQDQALLAALRARKAWAIEEVAQRFRLLPQALRWLNRRRGSPLGEQDLEDLAQDISVRILGKLDQIELRGTLDSWLCQFAKYELLNRLRVESRRQRRVGVVAELPENVEGNPGGEAFDSERLQAALAELDPGLRDLVRAKHFDGATFQQLGQRHGTSSNTIKTRYYKAILQLRETLTRNQR